MIGALAVNLAIGTSFPLSFGIAVGNTLGPLLATRILVWSGFHTDLKRSRDILWLAVAATVGMFVTASLGVTSLTLAGQLSDGQLSAWLIWWAGDVTGVIAAAPLVFLTNRIELRALWIRRIELVSWVSSITLSIVIVFFVNGANGPALAIAFIPFPLVVWAAIRFGPVGTSLGVIFLSFGAAFGTSTGSGPFYRSVPTESVLTLSLFMAISAAVGWLVSALTVTHVEAVRTTRILERALEEISFGVLIAGVDRRITYANSGFARLTGYSKAEILGKSCGILQGPETDPVTSEKLKVAVHGDGSFDSDILNYRKDGSTFWNALLISPLLNERGERAGFLGIQRDVTDRKLGQVALSRSEERYRAIVELEPECVKIVSSDGQLLEMNPAGLAMIEADSLGQVRGARLESLIAPEGRAAYLSLHKRVVERGEAGQCEFAIIGLKGTRRWLETHAVPYRNERHEIVGLLGITRDVTAQCTATAELERTVKTLRLFIDSVPAMIGFVDAQERFQLVNHHYAEYFAIPTDQILGRKVSELHPPEAYAEIVPRIREVLAGKPVHYQSVVQKPDGTSFWFDARYIPRLEGDGTVSGYFVMVFDIAEQKRAESELRASRDRLDFLVASSPAVIYTASPAGDYPASFVSANVRSQLGYEAEQFTADPSFWVSRIHPEDSSRIRAGLSALFERGHHAYEYRFRANTGDFRWMRDEMILKRDADGIPTEIIGSWIDVTEQKRAENQLRDLNALLESITCVQREFLVDATPGQSFDRLLTLLLERTDSKYGFIGQILNKPDGRPYLKTHAITNIAWDDASRDFYAREAPRGLEFHNLDTLFGSVITSQKPVISNRPQEDSRRGGLPPGHPSLDAFLGLPFFHGSELIGMVGVANRPDGYDERVIKNLAPLLTTCSSLVLAYRFQAERVTAELALRESEERNRALIANIPGSVYRSEIQPPYRDLFLSEGIRNISGYEAREYFEPGGPTCGGLILPDDLPNVESEITAAVAARRPFQLRYRIRHRDGSIRWVSEHGQASFSANGTPLYLEGIHLDVTSQVNAEQALRESEIRYRTLIETSTDAIFILDKTGRIRSANAAAAAMHGYTMDELLAMRIQDLDVPESADQSVDRIRRLLNGEAFTFEVAHRRKDGSTFPLEVLASATQIGGEQMVLAFDRDITDRKLAEEQVAASLREKEALLKEVHHRVKNNLQIITSLLNLQAETVRDPAILGLLRESQSRVRAMALVHETLYRSGDFGRIDLVRYLGSICNYLARSYGADTTQIQIDLEVADTTLDLDRAVPCGLIINELLSNALKHAFPNATGGRIAVRLETGPDQYYHLSVSDDGVGLPADLDWSRLPSLGLQLVSDLALQLGGTVTVDPGSGATFRIRFPVSPPPSGQRS